MGGWHRLGILISALWASLILLLGWNNRDENVIWFLIVPIAAIWFLGYAIRWVYRGFRKPTSAPSPTADIRIEPTQQINPTLWWGSVLLISAGAVARIAFGSAGGPNLPYQIGNLVGGALGIGLLALIIYHFVPKRTEWTRARFQFGAACLFAVVSLSQGLQDYERARSERTQVAPLAPVLSEAATLYDQLATRVQNSSSEVPKSETPAAQRPQWAASVANAMEQYTEAYAALNSKWEAELAKLQFESMLTPQNLLSSVGRQRNRDSLVIFETRLAEYIAGAEEIGRNYRTNVLAVDLPAEQEKDFRVGFESGYAKHSGRPMNTMPTSAGSNLVFRKQSEISPTFSNKSKML